MGNSQNSLIHNHALHEAVRDLRELGAGLGVRCSVCEARRYIYWLMYDFCSQFDGIDFAL